MATEAQIQALVREIAERFSPERIVLFGSHARGDTHADSDVDLLVFLSFQGHPAKTAARIRAALTAELAIDIIAREPQTAQLPRNRRDPLLDIALETGRTVYARAA